MVGYIFYRFVCFAGCHFESQATYGTLFTPGYTGNIQYPNYVECTWTLNVRYPIAIKFSADTQLQDNNYNRVNNRDLLKVKLD